MEYIAERKLIIDTCLELEHIGFFLGTWGNVSVRADDKVLLTPSRVPYQEMQPEDIVMIGLDGTKLTGARNPTSEKEIHRLVYLHRQEVNAVLHVHSPKAMAVSMLGINEVPCLVEEMSQLLGGGIRLTEEYVRAEDHFHLAEEAVEALGEHNAAILRNHGAVACGRDMEEALVTCKSLEKSCEIYLTAAASGQKLCQIPEAYVKSERYRYLYKYGKE